MATLYGSIGRSPVAWADVPTPAARAADVAGKVAAYVPGEVLSVYLLAQSMFTDPEGKNALGIWAVVCWVLALIVRWLGTKGEGKTLNVALTTLAFPIWVMAIGGTILGFTFGPQTSTLIVAAFSVLAGALYNNK